QEPVFTHRRAKIEHSLGGIVQENVGIVSFFSADFSEKQMNVLVYLDVYLIEAKPAGEFGSTLDATGKVESSLARRRQSPRYPNRLRRPKVGLFPDRIVGCERTVDVDGLRLQRAYVKRQHKPFK